MTKALLSVHKRSSSSIWDSSLNSIANALQYIVILAIILFSFSISGQQLKSTTDKINDAIDNLAANPNLESLKKVEAFSKTIATTSKSKDEQLAMVILYCNKAYYENTFGKTVNAIKSYETAWKIYQKNKLSNYDITEYCLKPLGNLYTYIGDYSNAENTIKQYYFVANQQNNLLQKQAAVLNLSNVYQNTGRIDQAIDLLEKTLLEGKLSSTQKGILYTNLGSNYFLNTKSNLIKPYAFENAEKAFLKAISLLEKDQTQQEALTNAYANLSKLKLERNDPALALLYFKKAKLALSKSPNPNPRRLAQLTYDEANLLYQLGNLHDASVAIQDIFKVLLPGYSISKNKLPYQNSLYAETLLLDALDLQAVLFLAQNQPKKALDSYTLSFYIEDLFESLLVYENSKIITQVRNRNRTEKCIAIYQSLFQRENKISYLENAFVLAEKSKSVVLKATLNKNSKRSQQQKTLSEQLQNWNTIIIKEQQKGATADISKINNAIKNQNELMLLLKENQVNENTSTKSALDLNALYTKLESDNAILIEYFSGMQNMYFFTIINKQIALDSFSANAHSTVKIAQFIDYFREANTIANDINGFSKYSTIAFQTLKLPVDPRYKNLLIIPDGILNFLPFEALTTQVSATTNFAKMPFLIHNYSIAYDSSIAFYLNKTKEEKHEKAVLGIFPIFDKTAYELTFSKQELKSIKEQYDGTFFENSNATFDNFKKNATDYSILHLSTHAAAGDLTTPASIKFYDQDVLYSELYNLNINPALVVLSACETGIGKIFKAEGAMSIARGFQFAGASNLLFSLWRVNDYTTSQFMDKFYSNLKKGSTFIEANHQAKLDYLADESISNVKKSPYYWSAFVYYGSLEAKAPTTNYTYYIVGFLVLISLFLIYIRYKK